ncbi:sialate:O-sulfotransferase 1-like [Saccoglossus kowalevskii]|uniref:WSC domain-containing protein 1-like n=1 Tax=Saccoglossus kowalevskii TaxID=10224 RepID=A0ABM0GSU8_SACKO|nr:PREDICTED: WSC domain-containing protein 1-like [Saccoglossus kowalevskii]
MMGNKVFALSLVAGILVISVCFNSRTTQPFQPPRPARVHNDETGSNERKVVKSDKRNSGLAYEREIRKNTSLNCSINFADPNNTMTPVWLTSFARSGNTWTRHLLELATGIYTGSCYNCNGLYKLGFKGELDKPGLKRELVYKCHVYHTGMQSGILLIRNAYDSLISFFDYKSRGQVPNEAYRNNPNFTNWAIIKQEKWLNLVVSWFESGKPFMVVHYEDMVKDTLKEVERILQYLNIKFTPERRRCVKNDIEGVYHRKNKEKFTFDPFTRKLHTLIDKDIDIVNQLFTSRNEHPIAGPTYNSEL